MTLTLSAPARIVPNRKKRSESSPDYFVKLGDSDLGVGWKAVSGGDDPKEYVRIVLDDPSFAEPVQAALFANETGADLVWTRRKD
jgi:uncharacterized protein (DUF736 family)